VARLVAHGAARAMPAPVAIDPCLFPWIVSHPLNRQAKGLSLLLDPLFRVIECRAELRGGRAPRETLVRTRSGTLTDKCSDKLVGAEWFDPGEEFAAGSHDIKSLPLSSWIGIDLSLFRLDTDTPLKHFEAFS
jgi:hypothetical protein